jgi:hypothetical protein
MSAFVIHLPGFDAFVVVAVIVLIFIWRGPSGTRWN